MSLDSFPLFLLSFLLFSSSSSLLLSLPYNISLSHFHSPPFFSSHLLPLSLSLSLPPLFLIFSSLLPSSTTFSHLSSPFISFLSSSLLGSSSPSYLLTFPYLPSSVSLPLLLFYLLFLSPLLQSFFSFFIPSTLLSSPSSSSSFPPYTPPLFCVCVWVCAAVVFRRCVQLICAASLLPQTPSLCKYLSPQYVTVCTSECVCVSK